MVLEAEDSSNSGDESSDTMPTATNSQIHTRDGKSSETGNSP